MKFPFRRQLDAFDCGPTCLQMVSEFYGKLLSLDYLREQCFITREGVSLLGISQGAEKIGLRNLMLKVNLKTLQEDCPLPAILHWNQNHFVVLYKIKKGFLRGKVGLKFVIGDPDHGLVTLHEDEFLNRWNTNNVGQGIALLLEPTSAFYANTNEYTRESEWRYLLKHLRPFRKSFIRLLTILAFSVGITACLPYMTKGLIDKGVVGKNHSLIILFILSQLILYISSSILDICRSWLLLHMNAKISLNIISDFLKKIMKLPIKFFDSKSIGDLTTRINDHHKIETFLTSDVVTTLFSVLQILIFSTILLTFKFSLWATFLIFSAVAVTWIFLFQKKREQLDYVRFSQEKNTQEKLIEMILGMTEVKLYNAELTKRWEWEHLQIRQYKLGMKSLKLEQMQQSGFIFLTQFKNLSLSYIAAMLVVSHEISLGVMLSISFIIGQTNGPFQQLVQFFKSAQTAKLSFSRLNEVHYKKEEEASGNFDPATPEYIHEDLVLSGLSFQYQGPRSPYTLKNLDIVIPKGKVTAIVGASGSGKTTLLKILIGFYQPTEGKLKIGDRDSTEISPGLWRSNYSTVMQDGYIFNDTVSRNITMNDEEVDQDRFQKAVYTSNLDEFVDEMPLKYKTKVGNNGSNLSGGQKQRLFIARAVYKNSNYLFFDEATSSLDANNETEIMSKLDTFFIGKTVVVIAHRLSTVKNADQIIVLDKGQIVEIGTHESLTTSRGRYFDLIKNQLELGA
ncbi:peptidase domain-containing ABC transporter [Mucilaginibacter achroorhodeus]|nr:peptidase domain-containing ABC transporter [Mucilaginibacter achroorhodeus]